MGCWEEEIGCGDEREPDGGSDHIRPFKKALEIGAT
jgi:hypothetical protein